MVPEVDRSKPDKSAAIQFNSKTTHDYGIQVTGAATDARWVSFAIQFLHRDLELPTISKYMKDASKRFFDIAGSHPNALLRAAVDYQPPHPLSVGHETCLPITRALAAVESLNDVNDT
ncbi:hypothetical protein EVAR_97612_1 [Eumeta japonica]|uniref:Uncharacterized protein n=1 Tax=Eumeta variegata TaxID=151549 RepID=A0A4C1XN01_EUMVA|nr:hypothetical protein EVAR_97612_1 [Eumeta japonica]